ncbi:MAG: glycoside hydrolase family 3 N-terminal domain-containing protein [Bryobacteraceae bacterium]|jgi:beta-glucosidase
MSSRESFTSVSVALALAAALAIASLQAAGTAPKRPKIDARGASLLKVGNLSFKDLNRNGVLDPYEDWRLPVDKRVADLLSRMTLEEKAGLMQITSFNTGSLEDYLDQRHIRYLILRDNLTARELAARANTSQELAEKSRLGIPIVFTSNPRNHVRDDMVYEEAEAAGEFSNWPGTLGLAATNDLKLIRAFAEIARAEWRASGIQKCYGYQVDVATEPRWYRIQTTFGESPKLNAEIAREIVLGFQGPALGPESVAQSTKHFPGDGAVDKGLDPHNNWGQWAAYPTLGSFFKYQLPPFQAAVDAGTSSIMSYYNNPSNDKSAEQLPKEWWQSGKQQFEEVAGAYNTTLLTRLLRGRMGFKGYVNTDSGVLANNAFGVEKLTTSQRFAKAVKAGVALFSDNNNPQGLLDAVHQHLLEESDLTPAVTLLLKEIFQLGLFENPYTDPELAQKIASSPASAARADEAHRKSIVLLRNDRKLLPMTGTRKLYVEVMAGQPAGFGGRDGAGGRGRFGGRGGAGERGAGDPGAAGVQETANPQGAGRRGGRGEFAGRGDAVAISGTARLKALLAKDSSVQIVNSIDQADAALLWLRPTVYQRPEHDYADIALSLLTGVDVAKVKQIEAAKPTVLVINFINPWVINEVEPGAGAVLATFDVKAEALLDVVRGRFKPAGKLPLTIPADQAAVDKNAPDVPGYAETFDYAYKNRVNDKYIFGFGLTYGK